MKIPTSLKKNVKNKENGRFAEFFLTASPKNIIRVLTRAAELANEDQRKLFEETKGKSV